MPNTTITETMLSARLQTNLSVRERIEAIAREKLWSGTGDPSIGLNMDALAWAVATKDNVRNSVREAMGDGEDANINKNIDAIPDELLREVVFEAMDRLKIGVDPEE